MPRPSDGHLKYVGGETRVVAVPRHITFSGVVSLLLANAKYSCAYCVHATELKERVSEMVEGETVLKYQIMPEELDILVSVRNDEDVKHMIQQYDQNSPKQLRAFLFQSPNLQRVRSSPAICRPHLPLPSPLSRQSSFGVRPTPTHRDATKADHLFDRARRRLWD